MEFVFRETEGEDTATTLELLVVPQEPAENNEAMIQEQRSVRDLITTLQQQQHAHHHPVKLLHLTDIHDFGEEFYRFFARSECPATLTTVVVSHCGGAENSRLLEAFYTNKSVKVLKIIHGFGGLRGFTLGNALSLLLVNNATVQRLECQFCDLGGPEAIRALQPGLRTNRNLKELVLCGVTEIHHYRGNIGDAGIRVLAETLQGNTQIELLDVSGNSLSAEALDDITTIIESCTGLQKLYFGRNHGILNNPAAARRFAAVLSRSPSLETLDIFLYYSDNSEFNNRQANAFALIIAALEEPSKLQDLRLSGLRSQECIDQLIVSLPRMKSLKRLIVDGIENVMRHAGFIPALLQNTSLQLLPGVADDAVRDFQLGDIVVATNTILARNCGLANANALLQLQPGDAPHDHNSGVWSEAIAKLGEDRVNTTAHSGATAIIKILREKPELLKQE